MHSCSKSACWMSAAAPPLVGRPHTPLSAGSQQFPSESSKWQTRPPPRAEASPARRITTFAQRRFRSENFKLKHRRGRSLRREHMGQRRIDLGRPLARTGRHSMASGGGSHAARATKAVSTPLALQSTKKHSAVHTCGAAASRQARDPLTLTWARAVIAHLRRLSAHAQAAIQGRATSSWTPQCGSLGGRKRECAP